MARKPSYEELEQRVKKFEEEARENYRAQQYLDLAGVMFIAINVDGEVTLINKKGCEILGYDEGEIIGKNWFENFVPERLRKEVIPVSQKLLSGEIEAGEYYENPVLTKQGEERIIAWHNTVLRDEQENIMGHLSSGEDVTDRKKAEEELRISAMQWQSTFDAISDGICMLDMKGTILRCNKAFTNLFGRSFEETVGRTCWEIVHNTSEPIPGCPIERMKKTHHRETMALQVNNRWLEVNAEPMRNEGGELFGAVHIISDITERKRLENQLRQSQKMEAIGTLAGGIAHEFNNLLWLVTGNVELALDEIPEGNAARSQLERVKKASIRARDLVAQILSFSRQTDLERKPLSVGSIVKESLKLLRASIPKTIKISQDISTQSDTILGDPGQIHQVFMNLCANSTHAMREKGGTLDISLSGILIDKDSTDFHRGLAPGKYVRLTVRDTGHGLDPEIKERIFDPFFTTKEVGEGTGMGLSAAHGIVKSHGGTIIVDSESKKGTTFRIYFPRIESEVEPETEAHEPVPTGNERILFIDDEELTVNTVKEMLTGLGYEVVSTTSPREALESVRSQPHQLDLVITDMTMPELTGEKLAMEMMKIRPDIPIILCTGYNETISEEKAKGLGIKEFLMKPIVQRDIAVAIRRVLDQGKEE